MMIEKLLKYCIKITGKNIQLIVYGGYIHVEEVKKSFCITRKPYAAVNCTDIAYFKTARGFYLL